MRMDKLTNPLQMALSDAQSLAVGRDNNFIEPQHLLLAMLDQNGGACRPLLARAGADVAGLQGGQGNTAPGRAQCGLRSASQ